MSAPPQRAFDPELMTGVLPDGRIAVVDSTTYEVKFVEIGSGITSRLSRPFSPRGVTRRDRVGERGPIDVVTGDGDYLGRFRFWLFKRLFRDELSRLEGEIEEEFRFHIDMKTASLEAQGMDPEKARERALEAFGNPEALRMASLEGLSTARGKERRAHSLDWLGQDVRDGFRQFVKHPGFSLLAVGTLAVGLATSTAVFTYVNAYRQPFPGADLENVFQLFQWSEEAPFGPLSYPNFLDLIETGEGLFEAATGEPLFAASVRHETLTEVVFGQGVTGDFFPLMNIRMSVGRALSQEDDEPGAPPAVIISQKYWSRRYGLDPGVQGRTILLNNRPHTIVGVSGPDFQGTLSAFRPDIWLPFSQFKPVYWARSDREVNREAGSVAPYLKLRGDVNPARVREALATFAGRLDSAVPLEGRQAFQGTSILKEVEFRDGVRGRACLLGPGV